MEKTLARYAECNFMFGLVVEAARDSNPELFKQLTSPVQRLPGEPDGEHSEKFIPPSHKQQMFPLSTIWGYAIPRVLIEERGRPEYGSEKTPEKIMKALELIDEYVPQCKTPVELVVKLSEAITTADADPKKVLYHLLSAGTLKEENCVTTLKDIIAEMEKSAPTLSALYKSLDATQRKDLGVVDF